VARLKNYVFEAMVQHLLRLASHAQGDGGAAGQPGHRGPLCSAQLLFMVSCPRPPPHVLSPGCAAA
jgi:hypothetical protein